MRRYVIFKHKYLRENQLNLKEGVHCRLKIKKGTGWVRWKGSVHDGGPTQLKAIIQDTKHGNAGGTVREEEGLRYYKNVRKKVKKDK